MSDTEILETLSAVPFDATLDRLSAAITQAGLILFNRIDHQIGARDRPIAEVLRRAGVPDPLAERLDPAQRILVKAVTS